MEKKKYVMPQVEVKELDGEVGLMSGSTGVTKVDTPSNPEMDNLSNRDNVWDMW